VCVYTFFPFFRLTRLGLSIDRYYYYYYYYYYYSIFPSNNISINDEY
jgi:hypothetical protein